MTSGYIIHPVKFSDHDLSISEIKSHVGVLVAGGDSLFISNYL